ncbi:MAG: HEPN domain-containing protein [Selenomonadaceae bacterium]|nr:HEPN domain-containing protein [Selenomonadaceae bacterium]MDD7055686.1 HEPN domain-containing protein [Selenomonadaceae bacterium]MDY3915908.1 HEPN domain-containing protein [Selenomonadaceae bacterium]
MNDKRKKLPEMETLRDIAERNLQAAETILRNYPNDDGMLNIVGYHLQQCIELALKHVLETHAVKYPRTHDIDDLLDLLPEACADDFTSVAQYARIISQLESRTRYIKGYRVKLETIKDVLVVAQLTMRRL